MIKLFLTLMGEKMKSKALFFLLASLILLPNTRESSAYTINWTQFPSGSNYVVVSAPSDDGGGIAMPSSTPDSSTTVTLQGWNDATYPSGGMTNTIIRFTGHFTFGSNLGNTDPVDTNIALDFFGHAQGSISASLGDIGSGLNVTADILQSDAPIWNDFLGEFYFENPTLSADFHNSKTSGNVAQLVPGSFYTMIVELTIWNNSTASEAAAEAFNGTEAIPSGFNLNFLIPDETPPTVPIPGAALLLGSGLMGLFLLRRRKQK